MKIHDRPSIPMPPVTIQSDQQIGRRALLVRSGPLTEGEVSVQVKACSGSMRRGHTARLPVPNMLPQSRATCIYVWTGYSPPPLSLRGHSRSASAQIIDLPLTEEKYTRRPVLSGRHTFTPTYSSSQTTLVTMIH